MLIPVGGDANISCSYVTHGLRPFSLMFYSNCVPCITRPREDYYIFDLVVTNFSTRDAGEARCEVYTIIFPEFISCYFNLTAAGEHDHDYY